MQFASDLDCLAISYTPELTAPQRLMVIQQLTPASLLAFVLTKAALQDVTWMRSFQEAGVFHRKATASLLAAPGAFASNNAIGHRSTTGLPLINEAYSAFFLDHAKNLAENRRFVSREAALELCAAACVVDHDQALRTLMPVLYPLVDDALMVDIDVDGDSGLFNGSRSMSLAVIAANFGSRRCLEALVVDGPSGLRFVDCAYRELGGLERDVSVARALFRDDIEPHLATLPLLLGAIRKQKEQRDALDSVPSGPAQGSYPKESQRDLHFAGMAALQKTTSMDSGTVETAKALVQIYADEGVYEIDFFDRADHYDASSNAFVRCARFGSTLVLDSMREHGFDIDWRSVGEALNHRERIDLWIDVNSFGATDVCSAAIVRAAHDSGGWDALLSGLQKPCPPNEHHPNKPGPSALQTLCEGFHAATFAALLECGLEPETRLRGPLIFAAEPGASDTVDRAMQDLALKIEKDDIPLLREPDGDEMRKMLAIYRSWLAAREARRAVEAMREFAQSP